MLQAFQGRTDKVHRNVDRHIPPCRHRAQQVRSFFAIACAQVDPASVSRQVTGHVGAVLLHHTGFGSCEVVLRQLGDGFKQA